MRSAFVLLLLLAGCSNGGNLSTSKGLTGPTPHPIRNAYFDPNGLPGSAPATWLAPVSDQHGTLVRPSDPSVDRNIPDYEHAPWLGGNNPDRPGGTF